MFGKRGEPGRSGLQVQPGVAMPFHDQKSYDKWHLRKVALSRSGTKAKATIQSISDVGTFDGRYVRVVAARLEPEGAAFVRYTSTVVVEPAATSPLPVGGTVTAFYDPRDQTTIALLVESPVVINIGGRGPLFAPAQPTARWRLYPPTAPNAARRSTPQPRVWPANQCADHCRAPLPVEPLT